jgi:hypothetical protein
LQALNEKRSANDQAYIMAANDLQTTDFGKQTVGIWRLFKATSEKGQDLKAWTESYQAACASIGEDVADYAISTMGAKRTVLGSYVTPAFNNDAKKQGVDQPTRMGLLMQVYAGTHSLGLQHGAEGHIPLGARTIGLATGGNDAAAQNIGRIVSDMASAPRTVADLTNYLSNGSSSVLLKYDAGSVDAVWNGSD